nr:hypothetical protein [Tanacetum cinerariifolium]
NPWLRTQEGEVRSLSPSQSVDESTRQKKKKQGTDPPQGDKLIETKSQEHREEKGGRV